MNSYLPYSRQYIDEYDIEAVVNVLKSDIITQGSKIKEFEDAIADYAGAKYAVAFNSGTSALHSSMFALDIKNKDQVITSPNTFCATSNSVLYQNAEPVFSDIDLNTYNLDIDLIDSVINKNTKAIIPVHFAGRPCDMDKLDAIKKKYKLFIVEDACHAIGAVYKNKKIGSISDITCFSFHPVKNITTGEGGIAVTNSLDLYQKMLQFRTHGITKDESLLCQNDGPWFYEMHYLGYNYRMTDFQAALGLSQLKKLPHFINCRNEIADLYYQKLKDIEEIVLPDKFNISEGVHAYHLFVIRIKNNKRKQVFEKLRKNNLGVNVHYIPVYNHPYYKNTGFGRYKDICKNMETYYSECISIPIYPKMQDNDTKRVADLLKKTCK